MCVCVVCGGDREGGVVGREEEGLRCLCVFVCDLCACGCLLATVGVVGTLQALVYGFCRCSVCVFGERGYNATC